MCRNNKMKKNNNLIKLQINHTQKKQQQAKRKTKIMK